MRVFIQASKEYIPHNYNFFNAYQGFKEMGHKIVMFHTPKNCGRAQLRMWLLDMLAPFAEDWRI